MNNAGAVMYPNSRLPAHALWPHELGGHPFSTWMGPRGYSFAPGAGVVVVVVLVPVVVVTVVVVAVMVFVVDVFVSVVEVVVHPLLGVHPVVVVVVVVV